MEELGFEHKQPRFGTYVHNLNYTGVATTEGQAQLADPSVPKHSSLPVYLLFQRLDQGV